MRVSRLSMGDQMAFMRRFSWIRLSGRMLIERRGALPAQCETAVVLVDDEVGGGKRTRVQRVCCDVQIRGRGALVRIPSPHLGHEPLGEGLAVPAEGPHSELERLRPGRPVVGQTYQRRERVGAQ